MLLPHKTLWIVSAIGLVDSLIPIGKLFFDSSSFLVIIYLCLIVSPSLIVLSYKLLKQDRSAYIVLLAWYFSRSFQYSFPDFKFNNSFGASINMLLLDNQLSINLLALLPLILLLVEIETFFPNIFSGDDEVS